VRLYWRVLLNYTLLVSESTAAILYEVGLEIEKADGERPLWDVEISDNRRVLVGKLALTGKEEMERLLLFFDPKSMPQELESLWVLRQGAAERGQKFHINFYGAYHWAEREARFLNHFENRPVIGANDAIVFVGHKPGSMLDRFASKHLDKVILFPNFILPPETREIMDGLFKKLDLPIALSERTWATIEHITKLLWDNYRHAGPHRAEVDLCHVIVCPGPKNQQIDGALQELIRVCANPEMKVNLLLDEETASEWIEQPFKCDESSSTIQ
jgi:hypothetical protein